MRTRLVMRSVTRRRSRALAAALGVAIGATTLVALAALALDIPRQMAREVRAYGANLLVQPGDGDRSIPEAMVGQVRAHLGQGDLVGVAPYRYETVSINSQPFVAAGTDFAAVRAVSPFWDVEGAWPTGPGEVLLGSDVATVLDAAVGDRIILRPSRMAADEEEADSIRRADTGEGAPEADAVVNDSPRNSAAAIVQPADSQPDSGTPSPDLDARVAGILATGDAEDGLIVTTLADLADLTGQGETLTLIEVSIAGDAAHVEQAAAALNGALPTITATPVTRLTSTDSHVLGLLRALLGLVALIVLALTMIAVAATTAAIVAERRTEIALRKALGAEGREIMGEFLGEAAVFGAVGGLAGAAAGYGVAAWVSNEVFHRDLGFTWWLGPCALAVSVAAALLASLRPVRAAVGVDPAVALRGE